MTKQEFLDFCHEEFTKRGFEKKRKNMYYLKGKDLLAGLYLQKSMAEAYYIEYNYFIGDFDSVKKYPTHYEADAYYRVAVLSKDTINGEHFMDACIEYGLYTKEELLPYFDKTFEEIILPPVYHGKMYILDYLGKHYVTNDQKEDAMLKLQSDIDQSGNGLIDS